MEFKTLLARLNVWLLLPIACFYFTYFAARLLDSRTSNLVTVVFWGVAVLQMPHTAWSYELRNNPYACITSNGVAAFAKREAELLV